MMCFPNAKINVGLNVLQAGDGYHNITDPPLPHRVKNALEIIPTCNENTEQVSSMSDRENRES